MRYVYAHTRIPITRIRPARAVAARLRVLLRSRWIGAWGVALCIHRERRYRSNIEEVWYGIPPSHRRARAHRGAG